MPLYRTLVLMTQLLYLNNQDKVVFLAKTDIKIAFRIIPILPRDYDLLGFFWQGKYYYDRVMPMGCASSCRTFEMFSTAIEWVAKNICQCHI